MSTKDFINKDKAEGGAKILHWVAQYVESNRDSTTSQDANLKGFMLKKNPGALPEDQVEAVFKGLPSECCLLHKVDPADPGGGCHHAGFC